MIGRRQTSRIIWGAVAGLALLAATTGQGEAREHGRWGHGGWGGGPLLGVPLKALNLTPEQQTQAHSIFSASFATARPLMQQLRQAQQALGDTLLASPTADVSAQIATINGLRGQLLQNRAQTTAQVLAMLDPDQLSKAAQIRTQMGQLRGQMHQLMGAPTQP
jgi:Spy/CpxP family protein refolding chaperone